MGTDENVPLGQYLQPLRDHAKLIAAITVVVALLGALATYLMPTSYQSTASILVTPISSDPTTSFESDVEVGMVTEERIATSAEVIDQVADRLAEDSIDVSEEELTANVTVSSPDDSRILDVSYVGATPKLAQAGADSFAQTYLDYRSQLANEDKDAAVESLQTSVTQLKDRLAETSTELLRHRAGSESFVTITVEKESIKSELDAQQAALADLSTLSIEVGRIISPAELPDTPEGVGGFVLIFGSLVGGFVLGCLAAFVVAAFKENTAARSVWPVMPAGSATANASAAIRNGTQKTVGGKRQPVLAEQRFGSADGIEVSTVPDEELAALLRTNLWDDQELLQASWPSNIDKATGQPLSERDFDDLLSRLDKMGEGRPISCICFGEVSRDASLAVGFGLAVALQAAGTRVLVVDLMLGSPGLHGLLEIPPAPGLLDVLTGRVSFENAPRSLPSMGDLKALTLGDGAVLEVPYQIDDLVNGWGMRSLLTDTAEAFEATVFIGGPLSEAKRLDLVVGETDGMVIGTEQPAGEPVGHQLAKTLSAVPAKTLGLISLDAALAAGAARRNGVPGRVT